GSEVRVHATVHLRTRLEPGALVPIGWVAVGDPARTLPPDRHDEIWEVQKPLNFPQWVYGFDRSTPDLMRARHPPAVGGARSPCRRRRHRWLRCWGLWRLRGRRFISALGAAEIPHISCEVSEDRMIRKDKVLSNVAVGNDQSIHADRFEQALRARASGDPANEHDVPVGRVLDGLGAEIGNEVDQMDDAIVRATSEAYPPLLSQYQKRLDAR